MHIHSSLITLIADSFAYCQPKMRSIVTTAGALALRLIQQLGEFRAVSPRIIVTQMLLALPASRSPAL